MKVQRKIKFVSLMVLFIIIQATAVGYANDELYQEEESLLENILQEEYHFYEVSTYASTNLICNLDFVRSSSTIGTAQVSVLLDKKADTMISSIKLQKYSSSKKAYVDTAAKTATQASNSTFGLSQKAVFSINSTGSYRIKVVIKVIIGGTTTTNTFYKKMI